MLCTPQPKLEELVTETLAKRATCTASEIRQLIQKNTCDYSVQAIYQELRKLQRAGVVVKVKQSYMLRIGWVLSLLDFASLSYNQLIGSRSLDLLIPKNEEKVSWVFRDLNRVVSFYTQLGLVLLHKSKSRICFEYAPRIWYHLAHAQNESEFLRALSQTGSKYFVAVGGKSFLDETYRQYMAHVPGRIVYGHNPLGPRFSHRYLIVIDDYVSTLTLDSRLEAQLERLYCHTPNAKAIEIREIQRVMHLPSTIRLKLEHAPRKARQLTRTFNRFWGLSSKLF